MSGLNGDGVYKLKIMSYNIWNYNPPWPERRKLIARLIAAQEPDVVGLQEVRNDLRLNDGGRNQIEQLVEELDLTYHFVYQPAMRYSSHPLIEEGLAIMSKYPIRRSSHIRLSRDLADRRDYEQRIVLRTEIKLPIGHLNFFNTHLSRSPRGRLRTVGEVYEYMRRWESELPKVLVGDFNAPPNSKPIKFLRGELEVGRVRGNLLDCWAMVNPHLPGFTNLPKFTGAPKRIDYVFITPRGGRYLTKVLSANLVGDRPWEGIYPSDHLGIVTLVALLREAG